MDSILNLHLRMDSSWSPLYNNKIATLNLEWTAASWSHYLDGRYEYIEKGLNPFLASGDFFLAHRIRISEILTWDRKS